MYLCYFISEIHLNWKYPQQELTTSCLFIWKIIPNQKFPWCSYLLCHSSYTTNLPIDTIWFHSIPFDSIDTNLIPFKQCWYNLEFVSMKKGILGSISFRDSTAPWVRAPVSKRKPGSMPCGHLFLLMWKRSAVILLCPVLWKINNGLGCWLGCVSSRPPLQLGLLPVYYNSYVSLLWVAADFVVYPFWRRNVNDNLAVLEHVYVSHISHDAQVFATMVSLLFQIPGLDFTSSLDHFECFSGEMSVTKGEWGETRCSNNCQKF